MLGALTARNLYSAPGMDEHVVSSPDPGRSVERRALPDRRRRPTTLWSSLRWRGRRKGFRRNGEGVNRYVDCPSGRTVILAMTVVVLSLLDALFTLIHLEQGGKEINPIMALVLLLGVPAFLVTKTVLTDLGILCLAAHQNFRLGRLALQGAAGAYSGLLVYHAILILRSGG